MVDQEKIIKWLFSTKALEVAPADQPFWYTSGLFGPYYINTHYLYGSKGAAAGLLMLIDQTDPLRLPVLLYEQVMRQYEDNLIYRQLMDMLLDKIKDFQFDFISGGARRDYFFSICAAGLLGKPHLSLQKDQSAVFTRASWQQSEVAQSGCLAGQQALHLADLVTEASSYSRAWLPGLKKLGARMDKTLAVVDRKQNGRQLLAAALVELYSLVEIDEDLFAQATAAGLIERAQEEQLLRFVRDPSAYITDFLAERPDFIETQLARGGQAGERAKRFLELNLGQGSED